MQHTMRKYCRALATGLLLVSGMAAHASTTTSTITVSGTLVPPPPACTFGSAPTLYFAGPVPTGASGAKYLRADAALSITYTLDTPYSLSMATQWSPVSVEAAPAGVAVYDGETGLEFSAKPHTGTGTGSPQMIPIIGYIGGGDWAWQYLNPAAHIGSVSGTVQFVLSY